MQRALLEWLALIFGKSWHVQRLAFNLPGASNQYMLGPTEPSKPSTGTVIKVQEFPHLLVGNKFADIPLGSGFVDQFVLPPGTKVTIKTPTGAIGETNEIKLHNVFCTVVISTTWWSGTRGLGKYEEFEQWANWKIQRAIGNVRGLYNPAPPTSMDKATVGFLTYTISVKATFNSCRIGHPEMPSYREWVDELVTFLRDDWDEELIFKRTLDAVTASR